MAVSQPDLVLKVLEGLHRAGHPAGLVDSAGLAADRLVRRNILQPTLRIQERMLISQRGFCRSHHLIAGIDGVRLAVPPSKCPQIAHLPVPIQKGMALCLSSLGDADNVSITVDSSGFAGAASQRTQIVEMAFFP